MKLGRCRFHQNLNSLLVSRCKFDTRQPLAHATRRPRLPRDRSEFATNFRCVRLRARSKRRAPSDASAARVPKSTRPRSSGELPEDSLSRVPWPKTSSEQVGRLDENLDLRIRSFLRPRRRPAPAVASSPANCTPGRPARQVGKSVSFQVSF